MLRRKGLVVVEVLFQLTYKFHSIQDDKNMFEKYPQKEIVEIN
jgi:hypothetical protein